MQISFLLPALDAGGRLFLRVFKMASSGDVSPSVRFPCQEAVETSAEHLIFLSVHVSAVESHIPAPAGNVANSGLSLVTIVLQFKSL